MTTSTNSTTNNSTTTTTAPVEATYTPEIFALVSQLHTSSCGTESLREKIWAEFTAHYDGAPNSFDTFVQTIGDCMARIITDNRVHYAELWEDSENANRDLINWDQLKLEMPEFGQLLKASNATQKWVKDKCGYTYTLNRLTMSKIVQGEIHTATIAPAKDKKSPKRVSATAPSKGASAEGADMGTPESGAVALESVLATRGGAASTLKKILDQYPELVNQKSVQDSIRQAMVKCAAKSTERKDKKAA